MRFKTMLLLISAILVGFVIVAEAGCTQSKPGEEKRNNKEELRAVEYANSKRNPLEALNKPPTFVSNDGETMTIECIKGQSLSGKLLGWYIRLLDNDSKLQKDSFTKTGMNSEKRRSSYMKDTTYLLIVRSSSQKPVGLTHFTFEMDPTDTYGIVYLWDLLVEESDRCRGIGTYLLDTVTDIGKTFNMRKTVLTVLKSNTRALKLYNERGFSLDGTIRELKFRNVLSKPSNQFEG